jgi:hypothetical protein
MPDKDMVLDNTVTTDAFTPLVTVAIPTYNRADTFLGDTIASVRAQSYPALEILISDNASTDNTEQIVRSLRDPRIRYYKHAKNIQLSGNLNFCIEQASGTYFMLLPDDDLIDPDFIETCIGALRRRPGVALVYTGLRYIDASGNMLFERANRMNGEFDDFVLDWVSGKSAPYLCNTLFRTEPLKKVGFHSKHYLFCDLMTEFKLAAAHGKIDIPDVKASFRMHAGEVTHNVDMQKWCDDSMELLELLCHLSPTRADLIRQKGLSFLAVMNYRRAIRLRQPLVKRLGGCLTVFRTHGFAIPSLLEIVRGARRITKSEFSGG